MPLGVHPTWGGAWQLLTLRGRAGGLQVLYTVSWNDDISRKCALPSSMARLDAFCQRMNAIVIKSISSY